MTNFEKVQGYLEELEIEVSEVHTEEKVLVINDQDRGICNMVLDCESDILILEQHIVDIEDDKEQYRRLLQINRELVHGAFVLTEEGNRVIFRDTLQFENLDLNEIEASLNSLGLALVEHADELLNFAGKAA